MKKKLLLTVAGLLLFVACYEKYAPKPRGYFKIDFPEKNYVLFDEKNYPYAFEYPQYATIQKDSSYFTESPQNPYWVNIFFSNFGATIYVSYIKIGTSSVYKKRQNGAYRDSLGINSLKDLLLKSYALAYKHTYKATDIYDSVFMLSKSRGTFFKIGGETATKYQFFITDSSTHYLRGVLYFDTAPNEDSLSIVNDFIKKDMLHLIETIHWK